MANHLDIRQLSKNVQAPPLEWVVSGLPVVAIFKHQQEQHHLGGPSLRNAESDNLLLWIGVNDAGHVLVLLTQRILSTHSNKAGRLLYLIVPTETLHLKVHAPAHWTLSCDDIPSTLIVDQADDLPSAHDAQLQQISFELGPTTRSRVIMPSAPVTSQVSAQRASLLHKLRNLSTLSCFELYTNHDLHVADDLRKVQYLLDRRCVKTPSISLLKLYLGPRNASIDSWDNEGISNTIVRYHQDVKRQNQDELAEKAPFRKKPRRLGFEPIGVQTPPTYDEACTSGIFLGPTIRPLPETLKPAETPSLVGPNILYLQIPAWLVSAWSLCPDAHFVFINELLTMCVASLAEDTAAYYACRVSATEALLSLWAKELHNNTFTSVSCPRRRHQVTADLHSSLTWLSVIDRHADVQSSMIGQADVHLKSNLKALASARESYLKCDDTSEHEDENYAVYIQARAWFVTKACLRLGASVLELNKDGIKLLMRQELDRMAAQRTCCTDVGKA